MKNPKLYFYDTGLISYFAGITNYDQYNKGPLAGSLFENYIISEIVKNELHQATLSEVYFLKTHDGAEIDLIVDRKSSKDFIEVKKSSTFVPKMITNLTKYTPPDCQSILLYCGEPLEHREVKIRPYWDYLPASMRA